MPSTVFGSSPSQSPRRNRPPNGNPSPREWTRWWVSRLINRPICPRQLPGLSPLTLCGCLHSTTRGKPCSGKAFRSRLPALILAASSPG
jgi:hypothetical protein